MFSAQRREKLSERNVRFASVFDLPSGDHVRDVAVQRHHHVLPDDAQYLHPPGDRRVALHPQVPGRQVAAQPRRRRDPRRHHLHRHVHALRPPRRRLPRRDHALAHDHPAVGYLRRGAAVPEGRDVRVLDGDVGDGGDVGAGERRPFRDQLGELGDLDPVHPDDRLLDVEDGEDEDEGDDGEDEEERGGDAAALVVSRPAEPEVGRQGLARVAADGGRGGREGTGLLFLGHGGLAVAGVGLRAGVAGQVFVEMPGRSIAEAWIWCGASPFEKTMTWTL